MHGKQGGAMNLQSDCKKINAFKWWKKKLSTQTRMELDSFDWRAARVCPIIQLRGIWIQGHQFGPACDVVDMLVFPGDGEECPFPMEEA